MQPVRNLETPPATLYRNARVITMDETCPAAEALATAGGRVLAVGPEGAVRAQLQERPVANVKDVDLEGACVVPGFIDSHFHPGLCVYYQTQLDLSGVTSLAELGAAIHAHADTLPADAWILGLDLLENAFADPAERHFPTKTDLDALETRRPVVVVRHDGHICSGNSRALDAAGITREALDQLDYPSGEVQLDADGVPTGVLTEGATGLLLEQASMPSLERLLEAARAFSARLAKFGITSCGGFLQLGADGPAGAVGAMEWPLFQMLIREGLLWQDYVLYFSTSRPKRLKRVARSLRRLPGGGDQFVVGGWKFFADGTFGAKTACLFAPFADDPGNAGFMVGSMKDLVAGGTEARAAGFSVATHAIGDKANRLVADAYQEIIAATPDAPGCCRVEHASMLPPDVIADAARAGIVCACQPAFMASEHEWLESRLGVDRCRYTYPFRALVDAGVVLAGASDGPVESMDVRRAIATCVTRHGFVPEQALTVEEALRVFTLDAARALGQQAQKGSLTPGKWADFVVLGEDPREVAPADIPAIPVRATYRRGRRIFPVPG